MSEFDFNHYYNATSRLEKENEILREKVDDHEVFAVAITRKEFLLLPMETRRRILERQGGANCEPARCEDCIFKLARLDEAAQQILALREYLTY